MGVLYARVSGAWVPVQGVGAQGPSGGPVPVGGAVGDLIIKNGTADFAVRWGINPPKVRIPTSPAPGGTLGGGDAHGLTVGADTDYNVAIYGNGLMGRNNGAPTLLRLNYYGGQVIVGGGHTDAYANNLSIADSAHATSRRAALALGTGWGVGQDLNANGTKDFYIYSTGTTRTAFRVDPGARIFGFGDSAGQVDLNLDGTLASNGAATPRISSDGAWLDMHAETDAYIDGNNIYFRSAGYAARGVFDSGGNFTANGAIYFGGSVGVLDANGAEARLRCANGTILTFLGDNIYFLNKAANAWIAQGNTTRWWAPGGFMFDASGYVLRHSADTDTGFYYNGDGYCGFVCNGGWALHAKSGTCHIPVLRMYGIDDNNHRLQYSNGTPTGSGEASNGSLLTGYTTVWLSTMQNKNFFMASGGSVFINAGNSYLTFSSREFKHNIKTLDPEAALLMVKRWNPVEFDWNDDLDTPHEHGFGFIAEEHVEVLPEMCHTQQEGWEGETPSESLVVHRPGWTNAIDYAAATPWLTAAIQAMLTRIEALETELEERNAA